MAIRSNMAHAGTVVGSGPSGRNRNQMQGSPVVPANAISTVHATSPAVSARGCKRAITTILGGQASKSRALCTTASRAT